MAYYHVPSYEVEVTISSSKDLKNVNWRHGDLKPYAIVWVDPNAKSSTRVDSYGNTSPVWDEKLVVSLTAPIEDSTVSIDIVQADAPEGTKPLIGSARLPLRDILDESGIGERVQRTLKLKRPSGRPQGSLNVKILLREAPYRAPPGQYYAPAYGVPPPPQPQPVASRDYYPSSYRDNYAAPPPQPVYYGGAAPPPPPPQGYPYDSQASSYGYRGVVEEEGKKKKGSKFGVGTGIAVGAVAGVLGGLALAEGADYVGNKIAENAAEKVENDLGDYGGDDYGGDDY